MNYSDRELLAKTIQAEAGNQGAKGMMAVGNVIMNRLAKAGSLSDVILAAGQFSPWNSVTGYAGGEQGVDMAKLKPSEQAYKTADMLLSGNYEDITGGATHFYNPAISNPSWGRDKAGGNWQEIGAHIFGNAGGYRTGKGKTMELNQQSAPQQGQKSGLLGLLQGGGNASEMTPFQRFFQNVDEATGLTPFQRFAAALDPMALSSMRGGEAIREMGKGRAELAKEKRLRNKSLEYLKQRAEAGDALARQYYEAAMTGALPVGAGIAGYLKNSTKVVKKTEAEKKIDRLQETGLPYEVAISIADGRFKLSRHPVTQRAEIIDMATGKTVGQVSDQVAENIAEVVPTQSSDQGKYETLPVEQAGGVSGWSKAIANKVTDALTGTQMFSDVGEVQAAMTDLSNRTVLVLDADFAGKPTNFTREIVERMTIKPAEIGQGPAASYQKAANMVDALEKSVAGARAALQNPEQYSPEQIKNAQQGISNLENLLSEYQSLKSSFETKGYGSNSKTSAQVPNTVSDEEGRRLIDKYKTPNAAASSMLPPVD